MFRAASLFVLAAICPFGIQSKKSDGPLDFKSKELPAGWRLTNKGWRIEDGELRGDGDGSLERTVPLTSDFTLKFDAWTEEKANIEVKIFDAKSSDELMTFAFLGKYHSVLDGVKCCILKGPAFVNVNSKMWIYPGRMFHFEVRASRGQYQMFLNDELGPLFADPAPIAKDTEILVRILYSAESKKDKIRIDNVDLTEKK